MTTKLIINKKSTSTTLTRCVQLVLGVAGAVLIIDCGILLANRVFHIGTILPLGIGLIFIGHAVFWHSLQGYLARHVTVKKLWRSIWLLFLVWLISFCLFVFYLKQHLNTHIHPDRAVAIIALGGGTKDNKPTVTVQARLDKASQVIHLFPQALIITSGGFDEGEDVSEAYAMAEYLHQQHNIALARIALEEQSTSTALNFINSKTILAKKGIGLTQPIIAVTSDFHTLRSSMIGKKQGYTHLQVVGADTPWYIRPNVWFREYFAFISGWLLDEY